MRSSFFATTILGMLPYLTGASPFPMNSTSCSPSSMSVRRDWGRMSPDLRRDFVRSVHCLMERPPHTPGDVAPGVKSRFDDFVAAHIAQVFDVHVNGAFLVWHRHFIHLFEKALKEECGYGGSMPFWDWPLYNDDLYNSPLFDGSDTSLGSDGSFDPDAPLPVPNGDYQPPRGNGGGCIERGPFSDRTTSFRYTTQAEQFSLQVPDDALDYSPHCMRRNLILSTLQATNSREDMDRILSQPDIESFQASYDSISFGINSNTPDFGVHAGGHGGTSGDMFDFFIAPADPLFYLHHATIDRLYVEWQSEDPYNRQYALNGTNRFFNPAGSAEITAQYMQSFYYLDDAKRVGDLMDVTKGPYCYRYEY